MSKDARREFCDGPRPVMERGLLFKDRLVRAEQAGRKTQTRRLMKPQPHDEFSPIAVEWFHPLVVDRRGNEDAGPEVFGAYDEDNGYRCPYGGPGDRLWVREAWMPLPVDRLIRLREQGMTPGPWSAQAGGVLYRATAMNPAVDTLIAEGFRWKPGIHLFRVAARTVLEVVQVRAERLQDISEEDAIAEGVEHRANPNGLGADWVGASLRYRTAREAFESLWDSINGDKPGASWAENPWVWAITFRRVQP